MVSSKVDFVPFCHSVLDTESSEFSHLWIPAFAGMTVFGLLTSSSTLARLFGEKFMAEHNKNALSGRINK
jgi:hypothetical protein